MQKKQPHPTVKQLRAAAGTDLLPDTPDRGSMEKTALPVVISTVSPLVLPAQGSPPETWPASFDLATNEGRVRAANAVQRAHLEPSAVEPARIRLHDYLIVPETGINEETGEVNEYLSLIMWDKDGRTLKTTGQVVMDRLARWLRLWPKPEDWRHLLVEVYLQQTRDRARTYHDARVQWVDE